MVSFDSSRSPWIKSSRCNNRRRRLFSRRRGKRRERSSKLETVRDGPLPSALINFNLDLIRRLHYRDTRVRCPRIHVTETLPLNVIPSPAFNQEEVLSKKKNKIKKKKKINMGKKRQSAFDERRQSNWKRLDRLCREQPPGFARASYPFSGDWSSGRRHECVSLTNTASPAHSQARLATRYFRKTRHLILELITIFFIF
ncbi:hypothetical protein PUN28_018320 [Cardiocondyla obscurior]|uniref:Uncharacterized protein n=1 Tax=Cardiocondyla obscurior TaxID=286306 RepID=A0AAW2EJ47_9HYME